MKIVFAALLGTLFMVIFNYTLTMMAGVYIVGELGGSNFITTYTVAFYALGNALGVPLGPPFLEKYGSVRVLVVTLLLFALFSFFAAVSKTFVIFIVFRFLQGLVSGPFYPLTSRLFAKLTPANKKAALTATILTLFVTVPVIGATWGGWIAYAFHWRWIFYFNIPIILALAWIIHSKLKGFDSETNHTLFDATGYFFFFLAILSLGVVLTMGQELDWFRSNLVITLSIIGCVCFVFFILWEIKQPYPILKLQLLKSIPFSFALINLALLFSAYFGMVILLALWLKLYVQYTPIWIGALLSIMAISAFLPVFLLEEKIGIGKIDTRIPLVIATLLLASSCFHTARFNVEIDFYRIAVSRLFAGFGLAFFLPPVFRLCFHTFPEKESLHVMTLFQVVRSLSSGIGASLYIILWQRRQVFYHDRLGSKLTVFSENTKEFFTKAKLIFMKGLPADAQLEYYLDRQATALALDDCFYLMGWIMIAVLVAIGFTTFMRSTFFCPEMQNHESTT